MLISELIIGEKFEGFCLLKKLDKKRPENPFFSLAFGDKSGQVNGVMWENLPDEKELPLGSIVKIRAYVEAYQNHPQLKVTHLRPATAADVYDLALLIPRAPEPSADMLHQILATANGLQDRQLQAVVLDLLSANEAQLLLMAAGKSNHHSCQGGWLQHTGSMVKMAVAVADHYPGINRDLLLAGTILHDIGKLQEFTTNPYGLVTDYSVAGNLVGHPVLGAAMVEAACQRHPLDPQKSLMLKHIVLSHHGQLEFGAPVIPKIMEAMIVNYLDLLDSRINAFNSAVENLETATFSERIPSLEFRSVYKHN